MINGKIRKHTWPAASFASMRWALTLLPGRPLQEECWEPVTKCHVLQTKCHTWQKWHEHLPNLRLVLKDQNERLQLRKLTYSKNSGVQNITRRLADLSASKCGPHLGLLPPCHLEAWQKNKLANVDTFCSNGRRTYGIIICSSMRQIAETALYVSCSHQTGIQGKSAIPYSESRLLCVCVFIQAFAAWGRHCPAWWLAASPVFAWPGNHSILWGLKCALPCKPSASCSHAFTLGFLS